MTLKALTTLEDARDEGYDEGHSEGRSDRPGIQTSEFKAATVAAIIGALAMFGVVDQGDVPAITDAVSRASGAVMVLVSAVAYIWSRVSVKKG